MFKNTIYLLCVLLCVGCTRTVKTNVQTHDTIYVEHSTTDTLITQQRASDTLYVTKTDTEYRTLINNVSRRDSVYIREKGDTITIYKEHWLTDHRTDTIYKVRSDTVYKARTDTVIVYKSATQSDSTYKATEEKKEVVKQKKDWKSRIIIGLLGFAVIGAVFWWLRKWAIGQ